MAWLEAEPGPGPVQIGKPIFVHEVCDFILQQGASAEVLEPAALHASVRQIAESIVAVYSPSRPV